MDDRFARLAALQGKVPATPAPAPAAPAATVAPNPLAGRLVVRRSRKGRGGKTVTVLQGVALSGDALETFARALRKALGCGATVESSDIVLQGDLVDRVVAHLERSGARRIVRGD